MQSLDAKKKNACDALQNFTCGLLFVEYTRKHVQIRENLSPTNGCTSCAWLLTCGKGNFANLVLVLFG